MGGEQQAVLVYGPKKTYYFIELVELFKLIDKKEWVKNFLETENHNYEEPYDPNDFEGIEIVFDQEFTGLFEVVMDFLDKSNLSLAFVDNCDWTKCYIGAIIDDYEKFVSNKDYLNPVNLFCEKYNLPKPTFFSGIIGEC